MCVVVYYYSDIKICGEGGGAGGRAADQRGAGAAAAARHLGLQRADSKICSTDWNRLRVCRSALVETWPMLGLIVECYSDIKICGEGGGAARRWSSCGSSDLGLQ